MRHRLGESDREQRCSDAGRMHVTFRGKEGKQAGGVSRAGNELCGARTRLEVDGMSCWRRDGGYGR